MVITGEVLRSVIINEMCENVLTSRREFETDLHLTHLLYCPHKTRYRRKNPTVDFSSVLAMQRGKATESQILKYFKRKYSNLQANKSFSIERTVGDTMYTIWMTPDAVIGDVTVELKTTKSLRTEVRGGPVVPYAHHQVQLDNYVWYNESKKGILLYYDFGKSDIITFDVHREQINGSAIEVDLRLAIVDLMQLPEKPMPRYDWECRFCDNLECPSNSRGSR